MTNNINISLEKFRKIQDRETSLEVWDKCDSTFKIQENKNSIGILLIHGFGSSPYEMKGLGERLFDEGFSVYSVRMTGHATNTEDFSRSGMESWLNSAEEAYDLIAETCSNRFIIGQSLGGAISLILGNKVSADGIVTLSGIAEFMDKKIKLTSFGILRLVFPNVKIDVNDADKGFIYEKRPTIAVSEMLKVRDKMIKVLPELQSPLLVAQAEDDPIIDPISVKIIEHNAGSELKEVLMFKEGGHRLTLLPDPEKELLFSKIVSFIRENSDS